MKTKTKPKTKNSTFPVTQGMKDKFYSPSTLIGDIVCKDPDYDIMFKVKNQAWLDKLKERCAGDEALFSRLA